MPNKIIPYNPALKQLARNLRKESTLSEVLLWQKIKGKALSVEFHRQVPIDNYIVDFYCHELMLAIEIDGNSHEIETVYQSDSIRQERLEDLGVRFFRISDHDVKSDMENVLRGLVDIIEDVKKNRLYPPCPPFAENKASA